MQRAAGIIARATLCLMAAIACGTTDSDDGDSSIDVIITDTGPGCAVDAHCSVGVCDTLMGTCVDCLFDGQCGPGQQCTSDKTCEFAQACGLEVGCTSGVCDAVAGYCVECLAETDCPPNVRCTARECTAYQPCTSSSHCDDGEVCDVLLHECVQCAANKDCAAGNRCLNSRCVVDQACGTDADCGDQVCDLTAGSCADCVTGAGCPDAYHCVKSSCVVDTCEAGRTVCAGPDVRECSADGAGWSTVENCADASEECVDGACFQSVCQPSEPFCNGKVLMSCRADGTAGDVLSDCGSQSQFCTAVKGPPRCTAQFCPPGELVCAGPKQVGACDSTGAAWSDTLDCVGDTYCSVDACVPIICTPNGTGCDGDMLITCNAVGSDVNTIDCVAGGGLCDPSATGGPACAELVCTPGTNVCSGGLLVPCNADGTGYTSLVMCQPSTYCTTSGCIPTVCDPNVTACTDGAVRLCDDIGATMSVVDDCAADGKTCTMSGGSPHCVTAVCKPDAESCLDGMLALCNSDGTAFTSITACAAGTFCAQKTGIGVASCLPQACEVGKPFCQGDIAVVCNAGGSGLEPGGTDCSAGGDVCSEGVCVQTVCEASQVACNDDGVTLETCSADGTALATHACNTDEHCNDSGGLATCSPDVCTAGESYCSLGAFAVCDAVGSGPINTPQPCDAGEICKSGAGETQLCTPESVVCTGDQLSLATCSSDGLSYSPALCPPNTWCKADPTEPDACVAQICTPGAKLCDGNTATVCNTPGSGPADGGSGCGDNLCQGGDCFAVVCVANTSFCIDESSRGNCNEDGTAFTTVLCGSQKLCSDGDCVACEPGACP